MNKQIARDRKLFCPNMAHVTAVRSPSGLNVNSALLLPAQAKTAPSPAEAPSKAVLALGSSFAQGDHASHCWKSFTWAKTSGAGAAIVAERATRYSEG